MSAEEGRRRGEADLAAGRWPDDWSKEEREAAEEQPPAFWRAYRQAREADDPPGAPAPLWFTVPAAVLGAGLSEASRSMTESRWMGVVVLLPPTFVLVRVSDRLAGRRAERDGFARRRDIPEATLPSWSAIPNVAWTFARRADLRRRGAWPPTWQTSLGTTLATVIVGEVRWRRAVAAARRRVSS